MAEPTSPRSAEMLGSLTPKPKEPSSARVLDTWITQAETKLGLNPQGGRLSWLIASSVAVAAVQRAVGPDGRQLFLLKGGTLLQHRLDLSSRATKDLDGLVRGDIDEFLSALDVALAEPWGPLTLRRTEAEIIDVPNRLVKPRRFHIILELRGSTWRRIQVEIAADEAGIGDEAEPIAAPPLSGFGLPDPGTMVGIALRFQIAQKLHAVTDPHDPPTHINDRPRDVVDLVLLRDMVTSAGVPTAADIAAAARAVFDGRAAEARQLGRDARAWPTFITAHPHWAGDYARAAASAGLDLPLADAIDLVNAWITELAAL